VPCVVVFFSFFFFFLGGGYLVAGVEGGPSFVSFSPLLLILVLRQSSPDEQLNALGRVGVERESGRAEGERKRERDRDRKRGREGGREGGGERFCVRESIVCEKRRRPNVCL
jgi:hypothetical protein